MQLLDGKKTSEDIKQEIAAEVQKMKANGEKVPHLAAVLVGNNGAGKTNVLDAIYMLANAKSYYNSIDQQIIQFNKDFFTVSGKFEETNPFDLIINFGKDTKKTLPCQ